MCSHELRALCYLGRRTFFELKITWLSQKLGPIIFGAIYSPPFISLKDLLLFLTSAITTPYKWSKAWGLINQLYLCKLEVHSSILGEVLKTQYGLHSKYTNSMWPKKFFLITKTCIYVKLKLVLISSFWAFQSYIHHFPFLRPAWFSTGSLQGKMGYFFLYFLFQELRKRKRDGSYVASGAAKQEIDSTGEI